MLTGMRLADVYHHFRARSSDEKGASTIELSPHREDCMEATFECSTSDDKKGYRCAERATTSRSPHTAEHGVLDGIVDSMKILF